MAKSSIFFGGFQYKPRRDQNQKFIDDLQGLFDEGYVKILDVKSIKEGEVVVRSANSYLPKKNHYRDESSKENTLDGAFSALEKGEKRVVKLSIDGIVVDSTYGWYDFGGKGNGLMGRLYMEISPYNLPEKFKESITFEIKESLW